MKNDGGAKDLEALLRDALNQGIDSRGAAPITQLKTMPLEVQVAPRPAALERESVPGLAPKLAPDSARPPSVASPPSSPSAVSPSSKKRSEPPPRARSSVLALVTVGALALTAATGAWLASRRPVAPVAGASATSPSTVVTTTEGAVGIPVTSRPAQPPPAETASTTEKDQAKAAETAKPTEPPPAVTAAAAPTPVAPVAAVAPETKPEAKPETKPETKPAAKAEAKPVAASEPKADKPEPKPAAKAHGGGARADRSSAPAEKADKADKPAAPPAPTPAAGSVDALLQQQLKGAIP